MLTKQLIKIKMIFKMNYKSKCLHFLTILYIFDLKLAN